MIIFLTFPLRHGGGGDGGEKREKSFLESCKNIKTFSDYKIIIPIASINEL